MKFWKKALIITGSLIVVFVFGYFISHGVEMSKSILYDAICNKTFVSSDNDYQLFISKEKYIRYISKEDYFTVNEIDYSDNFLKFKNEDVNYEYYVFNENSIYSKNLNIYLYHSEVI